MAEHETTRNPSPNAPQNPPHAVVNADVRRTALRTYLWPIIAFFILVALGLYWIAGAGADDDRVATDIAAGEPSVEGTTGSTSPEARPGGGDPQPAHESTSAEIRHRGGAAVTELGDLLDEKAGVEVGRRVEIADVEVEQVEGPAAFWVKDGSARIEVRAPATAPAVRAGQHVDIIGRAERVGGASIIRASHVTISP